jgi:preprotein translocase subunit SecD
MRMRKIGAALVVLAALALSACGGSGGGGSQGGGSQGGGTAPSGEAKAPAHVGSFAIYDWEPNMVAPPGVQDPTETGVSRAEAERLAAQKKGTIVLRAPVPIEVRKNKIVELKGVPRKYYVLRNRPTVKPSDVQSANVQVAPSTGQPSIIVQLTPKGAKEYEELTFREAKRGSTSHISGALKMTVPPRYAIVVGDEILSIYQLPAGTYTHGIQTSVITIVGGFDKKRAGELAQAIAPG